MGMCFGVRDAIEMARSAAAHGPLKVIGPLAHNPNVVSELTALGVEVDPGVAGIPDGKGPIMITAHGASKKKIAMLQSTGRPVIQATCPLVHAAHRALEQLVTQGYFPVVIGQRDHVEVRGMTEDLDAHAVILTEEDVDVLPAARRFGVVSQTTQPIDRVRHLVERCRARFPASEVRYLDTVCSPTKSRQQSAIQLAQRCHRVLVIGGRDSNNTKELVATCTRHCDRVHHIESALELRATWFESDETVGVTAGTSTPECVIDAVVEWLEEFNRFQVRLISSDQR